MLYKVSYLICAFLGAQGKSGSFDFAEGLVCVSGKAKYAICAVGCFIFSWVGLCAAKLVCWSVLRYSEMVCRVKVV